MPQNPKFSRHLMEDLVAISREALSAVPSNTFNLMMFAEGLIAIHLPGGGKTATAAGVVVQNYAGTFAHFISACLRSMGIAISHDCGVLQSNEASDEEKEAAKQNIAKMVQAGLLLASCVAVLVGILLGCSEFILENLDQEHAVADLAAQFLIIFILALPPLTFRGGLSQFLLANKDTKIAGQFGLLTLFISFAIALTLSFTVSNQFIGGFSGIAWGFVIGNWVNAIAIVSYIRRHYCDMSFFDAISNQELMAQLRQLSKIAGPFFIARISDVALNLVLSLIAGAQGVDQQSAWSYAMQMTFFAMTFSVAFAVITANSIARKRREGHIAEANRKMLAGFIAMVIFVSLPTLLVNLFPQSLYMAFAIPSQQQILVTNILPIVTIAGVGQSIRFNLAMYLRALHHHNDTTLVSLVAIAAGMLAAFCHLWLGLKGIANSYLLGESLACAGLGGLLLKVLASTDLPTQETHDTSNASHSSLVAIRPKFVSGCVSGWMSLFWCCGSNRTTSEGGLSVAFLDDIDQTAPSDEDDQARVPA